MQLDLGDPITTRSAVNHMRVVHRDLFVWCVRLRTMLHLHGAELSEALGCRMPWRSHGSPSNVTAADQALRAAVAFGIVTRVATNPTADQRAFGVDGVSLRRGADGVWNSDNHALAYFSPGPRLGEFVEGRACGWLTEEDERVCCGVVDASCEGTWPRHVGGRGAPAGLCPSR